MNFHRATRRIEIGDPSGVLFLHAARRVLGQLTLGPELLGLIDQHRVAIYYTEVTSQEVPASPRPLSMRERLAIWIYTDRPPLGGPVAMLV
jgi:hypothetical protein